MDKVGADEISSLGLPAHADVGDQQEDAAEEAGQRHASPPPHHPQQQVGDHKTWSGGAILKSPGSKSALG